MGVRAVERGYFSVVRWIPDVTRDEARNVAVVLVDAEGQFGGVRIAPPSVLSRDSRQQGFLDGILHGLQAQFEMSSATDLDRLREISEKVSQSLFVTSPRPTAVPDPTQTLEALFKAFVRRSGGGGSLTRGAITDKVIQSFRRQGFQVRRSEYVGEFVFDALVERTEGILACDVMSFATAVKDWTPTEREAGHFLFGLNRLKTVVGMAVIQPPVHESHEAAQASYERVCRWCHEESVLVRRPDELDTTQLGLTLV